MVRRRGLRPRTAASLRRYELTLDRWRELLEQGGGRCHICGKGGLTKHLSVDHDHSLEKLGLMVVRGLLCQRCNRALGAFEWSDDVLARAIDYMKGISLTRNQAMSTVGHITDTRGPAGAPQKGA